MNVPDYDITAVGVADHGVLRLTFADGTSGEVDVLARMRGPVFERARTTSASAPAPGRTRPSPPDPLSY